MSPTVGRSAAVYQRASDLRRAHLFSALALAFALLCTLAPAQAAASLGLSGNLGPATVGSQYSAALSVNVVARLINFQFRRVNSLPDWP
jgi:hypothetical protein